MTLGLVIGKFNPLHLGHEHLLATAAAGCDHLVVVISDGGGETIPARTRAGWIRDLHSAAEVLLTPLDLPEMPGPWARRTLDLLGGRRPDVVFSSEAYGDEYAALMGARHRPVDPGRERYPITGTALRADPGAHFAWLTAPARAALARRVCVVGAESTGTTTLAEGLARHYRTVWVPEYGRWYWEGRRHLADASTWTTDEFVAIATEQGRLEDHLARRAHRILVADTDPLATHVWHRRYLGDYSPAVWDIARRRDYDLYLLTAPDFAFVQDGTREGEEIRHEMHDWFVAVLTGAGRRFGVVAGDPDARLLRAVELVEPLTRFAQLR